MGKALVLKNVDFATNKLDTVTYGDVIPCTGLTISQDTITFAELGTTVQLTAVKTPANTTDDLIWSSSNADVATVSDGLVTCAGVGSATITAVCGSHSVSCAVTSTFTIDADEAYTVENGAYVSGTELPTKNHVGRSVGTRGRLYYSNVELGDYRAFAVATNAGKYAIPLPKGTSKITITPPSDLITNTRFALVDANTKQTYVTGADGNSAMAVGYFDISYSATYPYEIDISSISDANGFVLSVYGKSGTDASGVTGHTTIVFS